MTLSYNDSNKEDSGNILISPIEFNPIAYIGSNQKQFSKSTCISTRFHTLIST